MEVSSLVFSDIGLDRDDFSVLYKKAYVIILRLSLLFYFYFSIKYFTEHFKFKILIFISRLPGDSRTRIGFVTFDSTIHFYNLQEGLSQPQMLIVSDIDGKQ